MADNSKVALIRLQNTGVNTRLQPAALPPGTFQFLLNMISEQEGSITPRRGRKLLGTLPAPSPFLYRKFVTGPGEVPRVPSVSPRYIATQGIIWRSSTLATSSFVQVNPWSPLALALPACVDPDTTLSRQWSMATFYSGGTGIPWAFFACELGMFKDYGPAPMGASANRSVVAVNDNGSGLIQVTTDTPHIWVTGNTIMISACNGSSEGSPYKCCANGIWTITVVSETQIDLQGSVFNGTYTNGGNVTGGMMQWGIRPASGCSQADVLEVEGIAGNNVDFNMPHGLFDGSPITIGGITYYANASAAMDAFHALLFTDPTLTIAATGISGTVIGTLDGGAPNSPAGSVAYKYVYTYRNPLTGNEGNPSREMLVDSQAASDLPRDDKSARGTPVVVNLGCISLEVWGTDDFQIPVGAPNTVAIYRTGGLLTDGVYRFVGYTYNPGGNNTSWFLDNVSDTDLVFQTKVAEFDNDPPVTSSLSKPYVTTILGGPYPAVKFNDLFTVITVAQAPPASVGNGTLVHFLGIPGLKNQEDAVIWQVVGNQIWIYNQYQHAQGERIEIDAVVAQPCNLSTKAFDNIFVAGDPNNLHVLYKSKAGSPESFPVIDALGNAGTLNVASPSDPIINLTEFRGNILTMNSKGFYEVSVFNGVMYAANATPAQRGLMAMNAWCVAENEIWYLSYDGIWSWSGGQSLKRSESIDSIFHGLTISTPNSAEGDTFVPIQLDPQFLQFAKLCYERKKIHLLYINTGGEYLEIVYDVIGDRWLPEYKDFGPNACPERELVLEPDTGNLIFLRSGETGQNGVICLDDVLDANGYTSDEFSNNGVTQGSPIVARAITGWLDGGDPFMPKVIQEIMLEMDQQGLAGSEALGVNVFYDYGTLAVDTFHVPAVQPPANNRAWISLQPNVLNDSTVSGFPSTYARQASVLAFEFGMTVQGYRPTIYAIQLRYREVGMITAGPYYDWSDLGYKYDKRMYQFTVEFDTNEWNYNPTTPPPNVTVTATSRILILDTISGISGNTETDDVQYWTITNPVILGPGRAKVTLPIKDGVIVKMVRIRSISTVAAPTQVSTLFFRILNCDFQFEQYPADIVPFTEPEDGGYEYAKYANQIDLDVDTNNIPVTVQIQADGTTAETITVQSTSQDRQRNFTLNPNLSGRKWRLYINPAQAALTTGGGKFQLFGHRFGFQKADPGEVIHTKDWDDLGHPYDKRLYTVMLEWDNTSGADVIMQLDLLSGIDGATVQSAVQTFDLGAGSGRTQKTFALVDGLIAKKIRLYPQTATLPVTFRHWRYVFQKEDYPADTVAFTPWEDGGYAYDKYANQIDLDVDTNNVDVTVNVETDSLAPAFTFTVTGTSADRQHNVTLPSNFIGKKWRLFIDPNQGALTGGGKFQLFGHAFIWEKADPGAIAHTKDWDDLGHPYDKRLYTVMLEWDNTTGADVVMQLDLLSGIGGGTLQSSVQTFDLGAGSGRTQRTFPLIDGLIAKKIRIYPLTGTIPKTFRHWRYVFQKEDYPADIVCFTSWEDGGYAYAKYANQIDLDVDTNNVAVTVNIETDSLAPAFTFPVTSTSANRQQNITLPPNFIGKKWRLYIDPAQGAFVGGGKFQLFGHAFIWEKADPGAVSHTKDWDDLGHPYDKRLYTVMLEWDNTTGADVVMQLDLLSGIGGGTVQSAVQTFDLGAGSGRTQREFALIDGLIAKKIRLYPQTGTLPLTFRHWRYVFQKEDYPADTVAFTPWEDGSYEYDKYLNQVDLDVDTNNVAVTVSIETDSLSPSQSFQVTGTNSDRQHNFTIKPNLIGKKFRLYIDPGQTALVSGGGKFQLFNHHFVWEKADPGAVAHTKDWDDLGHPYDKRLYTVMFEWDNTSGADVVMQMDCLVGVDGGDLQTAVQTFDLAAGTGRSQRTFPLVDGLIAKKIRFYPQTTPLPFGFKSWRYTFQKEDYPADIIAFTPWEDNNYEYDKYLNQVDLDVDTNGIPVPVHVQADGATVFTFLAQGTVSNRRINITTPTNLVGKKWRLLMGDCPYPLGAKFQLFSHSFKWQKADEGEVIHTKDWDDLDHPYDKRLYTVMLEWDNTTGADVVMQLDLLSGIGGGTIQSSVQTFDLGAGSGRTQKTFPLIDGLIAKKIRLYPRVGTIPTTFKHWRYLFQKEDYPADIVCFTPWEDGGYAYLKFANQIDLDVDTNNVAVTVTVETDSLSSAFSFPVTGTNSDRQHNITLPPNLIGKKWRLFIDPAQPAFSTGGGKFQLFNHTFIFEKADLGAISHTKDWDDLAHPYDKRLYTVTMEWDNTSGADVIFQLDCLVGVDGGDLQSAVQTFNLGSGTGRTQKTFALVDGLIAKKIRLYPQTTPLPLGFRSWKYTFQKEDYPADTVSFTPWEDGGYEYDKYCNQIDLDLDTNGIDVPVHVQADGTTVFTFPATGTVSNRRQNVTMPTGLVGKKWRLLMGDCPYPLGAKFQLFSHSFKWQKADIGEVTHTKDWDDLGHPYDKRLYTVTMQWDASGCDDIEFQLDLLSGINGGDQQIAAQTFNLGPTGRSLRTFALADGLIAKMVRVHPKTTPLPAGFKSWEYRFSKEDYPADIVAFTSWEDGGYEYDKYCNQIDLDVDTNDAEVTVAVETDSLSPAFTFTVKTNSADRRRNITMPANLKGRKWRLFINPSQAALTSGCGKFQIFSHRLAFQKADPGEVRHTFDFDDLGYPQDKRLYTVSLQWDNTGTEDVQMVLDVISGISGGTLQSAVATFDLGATGRSLKTFALPDGLVAKLVRFYPQTTPLPTTFKAWGYAFQKEDYPPDVVAFTPWEDGGYEYEKYANQLNLDVDTNNIPITVNVETDNPSNANPAFTFEVQTDSGDRRRNITLPPNLMGKKWRLFVDPAQPALLDGSGKFQIFTHSFIWEKADPGQISHSKDWDDLGHPYDKRLYTLTLEWDNTSGFDVIFQLDCLVGVDGGDLQSAVQTFNLGANSGRSQRTFPLVDGLIAKKIRLYPQTTPLPLGFRSWKYSFQKEDYPADTVSFTPWEDGGYEYDKYCNQVDLDVDTNGIEVPVHVQADGVTVFTFPAFGTTSDRRRNITMPSGIVGKKWRLLMGDCPYPLGAKFQLFGHSFKWQKADVGEVTHTKDWDDLGHPYDKRLYTVTLQWDASGCEDIEFQLDLLSGVRGGDQQLAVQTFNLGATGRSLRTFPLVDGLIAKMIRLHPTTTPLPAGFKSWEYRFQKEDYPADIVCFTSWEDGGYEYDKYAQQIDLDVDTNEALVTVSIETDSLSPAFTFAVQTTSADRRRNITLPPNLRGRKWRLFVDPAQASLTSGCGKFQLFSHRFAFQKADPGEVKHTFDFDDLGHPYDKRLYTVNLQWDNTGTEDVKMVLDIISGIAGGTVQSSVAVFDLGATGRSLRTFPLPDGLIAKLVRFYPQTTPLPTTFKSWGYQFQKEDYPADIVAFTPWEDGGYEYEKYANQLDLEVDTNSVPVTVNVETDDPSNANPVFTFTVLTDSADRRRNITLPANLAGKKWRLFIDPAQDALLDGSGKFQLFGHRFGFQKADLGEIVHSTDWDDLGHPYDKRLSTVTMQWDNTSGFDVVMQLDLKSGIDGGTLQAAIATFALGSNIGRSKKTFPLPDGLICKLIRLYPQTNPLPIGFRIWQYSFAKADFPADIVEFTEPTDFGYQYDKIARTLTIKIDTGGVDCAVDLIGDDEVKDTYTINTTLDDWRRMVAVRANQIARLWKLALRPGPGGRAQLFSWELDIIKEPPQQAYWTSYEQAFGYNGLKFLKQCWIEYVAPRPVSINFTSDTGTYTLELPAHPRRTVERFYLPVEWESGLNKSITYQITLNGVGFPAPPPEQGDSRNLFKIYPDSSRIEWIALGADRRMGYQQMTFSELSTGLQA